MTLSDFLVSRYELALSLLLLGLYLFSGLIITFLAVMNVGLVLGNDKGDTSKQIEIHGV